MHFRGFLRRAGAIAAGVLLSLANRPALAGQECLCPGDYNGSGAVDGGDLGLLLGAWGTVNVEVDLTGNGFVDGADLGVLLSYWGPCLPPSNDYCVDAEQVVPESVYEFCNLWATTDGPSVPGALCGGATAIYNDVWYRFDATSDGILIVDTCLGSDAWDTVVAVYGSNLPGVSPCPNGGASLAPLLDCSDDATNTLGCGPTESYVSLLVTGGRSYKIRVGGRTPSNSGEGVLRVSFNQFGSSCGFPLEADNEQGIEEVLGTTTDNEVDELPSNCFGTQPQGPAEWISYTAACTGTYAISTCHPNTDFDTVLNVMLDTPGTAWCWESLLGCNDDSPAPGCQINGLNRRSRVDVHVNAGDTLKIAVSGYNGASGNYGLVITRVCD